MLDPKKEKIFSACELTRLIQTEMGIERSHMTIRRWMRKGCRRKGRQIRLESIDVGGQLCSSLEAIQRFFDRLSEGTHE